MRKRFWIAVALTAGAVWGVARTTTPSIDITPSQLAARSHSSTTPPTLPGLEGDRLMPAQDERVADYLAAHPVGDDLRSQLTAIAETQQIAFAPRHDGEAPTPEQRDARRAERVKFRKQVHDALAAMSPDERAALRKHHIDIVRLALSMR